MSTINIKPKGIAYKPDATTYTLPITYNEAGVTYNDFRYTYDDIQINLTSSIRPTINSVKTVTSKIGGINIQ